MDPSASTDDTGSTYSFTACEYLGNPLKMVRRENVVPLRAQTTGAAGPGGAIGQAAPAAAAGSLLNDMRPVMVGPGGAAGSELRRVTHQLQQLSLRDGIHATPASVDRRYMDRLSSESIAASASVSVLVEPPVAQPESPRQEELKAGSMEGGNGPRSIGSPVGARAPAAAVEPVSQDDRPSRPSSSSYGQSRSHNGTPIPLLSAGSNAGGAGSSRRHTMGSMSLDQFERSLPSNGLGRSNQRREEPQQDSRDQQDSPYQKLMGAARFSGRSGLLPREARESREPSQPRRPSLDEPDRRPQQVPSPPPRPAPSRRVHTNDEDEAGDSVRDRPVASASRADRRSDQSEDEYQKPVPRPRPRSPESPPPKRAPPQAKRARDRDDNDRDPPRESRRPRDDRRARVPNEEPERRHRRHDNRPHSDEEADAHDGGGRDGHDGQDGRDGPRRSHRRRHSGRHHADDDHRRNRRSHHSHHRSRRDDYKNKDEDEDDDEWDIAAEYEENDDQSKADRELVYRLLEKKQDGMQFSPGFKLRRASTKRKEVELYRLQNKQEVDEFIHSAESTLETIVMVVSVLSNTVGFFGLSLNGWSEKIAEEMRQKKYRPIFRRLYNSWRGTGPLANPAYQLGVGLIASMMMCHATNKGPDLLANFSSRFTKKSEPVATPLAKEALWSSLSADEQRRLVEEYHRRHANPLQGMGRPSWPPAPVPPAAGPTLGPAPAPAVAPTSIPPAPADLPAFERPQLPTATASPRTLFAGGMMGTQAGPSMNRVHSLAPAPAPAPASVVAAAAPTPTAAPTGPVRIVAPAGGASNLLESTMKLLPSIMNTLDGGSSSKAAARNDTDEFARELARHSRKRRHRHRHRAKEHRRRRSPSLSPEDEQHGTGKGREDGDESEHKDYHDDGDERHGERHGETRDEERKEPFITASSSARGIVNNSM